MSKILAILSFGVATLCFSAAPEHVVPPTARAALEQAQVLEKEKKRDEALAAAFRAVEADPDFLGAHDWLAEFSHRWVMAVYQEKPTDFVSQSKAMQPRFEAAQKTIGAKYEAWRQRFPNSLGVQYGTAKRLFLLESPDARAQLLKLAERAPTMAKVFEMLAGDAIIRGDEEAAAEYFSKAMKLEPDNAQYAFASAYNAAPSKRQAALQDVVKRFPKTEQAADALVQLSEHATDDAHRIQYLEQLRTQFPPNKAGQSNYGMQLLFEIYLRADPAKAAKLAQEMQAVGASKDWTGRADLAQAFIDVNQKLKAGKANEAVAQLSKLQPQKRSANAALVERVKAQVMADAGQPQAGYKALLAVQATRPDDATKATLETIGKQLRKTPAQVQADIKAAIYADAKPAPAFDLQKYTSDDTVSLAKLRGKVVLLNFWFPGCGPCAREFPHMETAMQRLRLKHDDVVYIGINIVREQDTYVLPLMEKKGYSFTPLKGTDAVKGAEKGYGVVGAPANFVIDRSGKIVYSGFTVDYARDSVMLQRMIESVL